VRTIGGAAMQVMILVVVTRGGQANVVADGLAIRK